MFARRVHKAFVKSTSGQRRSVNSVGAGPSQQDSAGGVSGTDVDPSVPSVIDLPPDVEPQGTMPNCIHPPLEILTPSGSSQGTAAPAEVDAQKF